MSKKGLSESRIKKTTRGFPLWQTFEQIDISYKNNVPGALCQAVFYGKILTFFSHSHREK